MVWLRAWDKTLGWMIGSLVLKGKVRIPPIVITQIASW